MSENRVMSIELQRSVARGRREALIDNISRGCNESEVLKPAGEWFTKYIDHKLRAFWSPVIQQIVGNVDHSNKEPSEDDVEMLYDLLSTIADALATKHGLSMNTIVEELRLKGWLRNGGGMCFQVVFAMLGWLSMPFRSLSS